MSTNFSETPESPPIYPGRNKIETLEALADRVPDGATVAVGGGLSSREPMALLRALLRRRVKGLTVVGSAHGIDIDLLCGGGAVARSAESYVGFEQDFGMAPNFRRVCESNEVTLDDNCCYTLVQQLRAAIFGLPFMPIRSVRGTDFEGLHPEFKQITCPFTNETLMLVPALAPDVALLHAQYADTQGNLRIEGPPVADILFAKASRVVLATVEQIVSTDELHKFGGVTVPYFYVTALAEVPMGAHPTACYPFYAYDRPHTARYYEAAKRGPEVFRSEYLQPYVYECGNHADYLEKIDAEKLGEKLGSWNRDSESWMSLYREDVSV